MTVAVRREATVASLAELREACGATQHDIGRRVGGKGVSASVVCRFERGQLRPSRERVAQFVTAYVAACGVPHEAVRHLLPEAYR